MMPLNMATQNMSPISAMALNLIFGAQVATSFMFFTNESLLFTCVLGMPKRNTQAPIMTDSATKAYTLNWRYRLSGSSANATKLPMLMRLYLRHSQASKARARQ